MHFTLDFKFWNTRPLNPRPATAVRQTGSNPTARADTAQIDFGVMYAPWVNKQTPCCNVVPFVCAN